MLLIFSILMHGRLPVKTVRQRFHERANLNLLKPMKHQFFLGFSGGRKNDPFKPQFLRFQNSSVMVTDWANFPCQTDFSCNDGLGFQGDLVAAADEGKRYT